MLDVVYPYKRTRDDAELRYSLRSLTNLPHGDVWIVGDKPAWLTGVRHLPGNRFGYNKPRNVFDNIQIACEHADMPDRFVILNDDFFILTPTPAVVVEYRCGLAEHIASLKNRNSPWCRSLRSAKTWLEAQGITDALSYELHKPFPVDKQRMAATLAEAVRQDPRTPPQWRTVYGNRWRIGGAQAGADCKRYGRTGADPLDGGHVSSSESSWAALRPLIAERFPNPSPYEQDAEAAA